MFLLDSTEVYVKKSALIRENALCSSDPFCVASAWGHGKPHILTGLLSRSWDYCWQMSRERKDIWYSRPEAVETPCGTVQPFSLFAASVLEESSCWTGRATNWSSLLFCSSRAALWGFVEWEINRLYEATEIWWCLLSKQKPIYPD